MKLTRDYVKSFYNQTVNEEYHGDYEHFKWFSTTGSWQRYLFHHKAIMSSLNDLENVNNCLELGPGSGIWTKKLITKFPHAKFDLLDISKSMLDQAKLNLGNRKNVEFIEGDILDYQTEKRYDLIFASRVIEYIPEKEELITKLVGMLNKDGKIVLITKMPLDLTLRRLSPKNLLRKRKEDLLHTEQCSPQEIEKILNNIKGVTFKFRPVAPIRILHKIFLKRDLFKKKINILKFFLESYMVEIRKIS